MLLLFNYSPIRQTAPYIVALYGATRHQAINGRVRPGRPLQDGPAISKMWASHGIKDTSGTCRGRILIGRNSFDFQVLSYVMV